MNVLISSNFKKHFNTYIDFVDHYWIKFFELRKINFIIVSNSIQINWNIYNKYKIKLIIIPGGNDLFGSERLSKVRLNNEFKLIKFGLKNNIPILGICRGMQVINYYFKGKQKKFLGHMNTTHDIIMKNDFFKKKILNVNSFHNYIITEKLLSKKLNVLATDKDKNIEFFSHKSKKIFGIMWHPERNKNYKQLDEILKKLLN